MALLVFFFAEDGCWIADDLEIYARLNNHMVIVNDAGDLFILDAAEARILRYNRRGERVAVIGREGQGPGEYLKPGRLQYLDGRIYVHDRHRVHVLDAAGVFRRRVKLPDGAIGFYRVKNGWMCFSNHRGFNRGEPGRIRWYSEGFEEELVVAQRAWEKPPGRFIAGKEMAFNPVAEKVRLQVSPDGKRVFFYLPGAYKISIYDVEQRKITALIERDVPAIPLDRDWAEERLGSLNRANGKKGSPLHFKADFPDSYPALSRIMVMVDGLLRVSRQLGPRQFETLYFNERGKAVEPTFSVAAYRRVAALDGDWAYVTMFDVEEDEARIARCRIEEVEAFVRDHPDRE